MTARTDPEDHTVTTPGHPPNCSCGECEHRRATSGLHGIDLGDGGRPLVFCERENLLAMYPHECPADAGGREHQAEEKPCDHPQGTGTICDTCGADVAAMAPETALSATQAAQEPSAGGNGWAEALSGLTGQFEVYAFPVRSVHMIGIVHRDCPNHWCAEPLSDFTDLAELVRRAGEHTEVCR